MNEKKRRGKCPCSHEKPPFEQKPTVLSIKDSKASVSLYMRHLSLLCHRDEGQTNPLNRVHCEGWLKTDEQLKAMRLRVPLTLFCIIGGHYRWPFLMVVLVDKRLVG